MKMSGTQQFESLKDEARSNVGGSTYSFPKLSVVDNTQKHHCHHHDSHYYTWFVWYMKQNSRLCLENFFMPSSASEITSFKYFWGPVTAHSFNVWFLLYYFFLSTDH